MGRDLNLEDANIFVFQRKVVRGFRGDLDLARGLSSQEWNQEKEEHYALHAGDCSTGIQSTYGMMRKARLRPAWYTEKSRRSSVKITSKPSRSAK